MSCSQAIAKSLISLNISVTLSVLRVLNLEALKFLNSNKVICVAVATDSTHLSSPLDVAVFKPFNRWFSNTQIEYSRDNKNLLTYVLIIFMLIVIHVGIQRVDWYEINS